MDVDTREELAEATAMLETAKGPRVRSALSEVVTILQAKIVAPKPASESTAVAKTPATVDGGVDASVPAAASGSQLPEADIAREAGAAVAVAPATERVKVEGGVPATPRAPDVRYATVDRFSWDQGSYSSPKVTVYVPLAGVGAAKERVSCSFTARGFDLMVKDLDGKSYRLLQNNLDKDIVPEESKILVKKDKVLIKLQKVKAEYGSYDNWSNLAAKKTRRPDNKTDPQAGLMDMMKDMYDDGDDSTKKLIGEAMMKSQQGRGSKDPMSSFDDPLDYGGGKSGKSSKSSNKRPFGGAGSGKLGGALGGALNDISGGLGGLGAGLGGGIDSPPGNFDDGMDDDLDLGKVDGDDGWGAGGKDDFGFGSAVPPPRASEPVPAATSDGEEDEQAEDEEEGGGKEASAGDAGTGKASGTPEVDAAAAAPLPPPSAGGDGGITAESGDGAAGEGGGGGKGNGALPDGGNPLEALDD